MRCIGTAARSAQRSIICQAGTYRVRVDRSRGHERMDLPGFRLHTLKGRWRGFHAVPVSGNRRVIFRFEHGHAVDVDSVDYPRGKLTMETKNPGHPGALVRENCLKPLGLSVAERARRLGVGRQTLSRLVNAKASVSLAMAYRPLKVSPLEVWLGVQLARSTSLVHTSWSTRPRSSASPPDDAAGTRGRAPVRPPSKRMSGSCPLTHPRREGQTRGETGIC